MNLKIINIKLTQNLLKKIGGRIHRNRVIFTDIAYFVCYKKVANCTSFFFHRHDVKECRKLYLQVALENVTK